MPFFASPSPPFPETGVLDADGSPMQEPPQHPSGWAGRLSAASSTMQPPVGVSAQGRGLFLGDLTPHRGPPRLLDLHTHLVGLYGPRLHVQVPDLDREVIPREHVAPTVAELHIGHRGDDL